MYDLSLDLDLFQSNPFDEQLSHIRLIPLATAQRTDVLEEPEPEHYMALHNVYFTSARVQSCSCFFYSVTEWLTLRKEHEVGHVCEHFLCRHPESSNELDQHTAASNMLVPRCGKENSWGLFYLKILVSV